MTQGDIVPRGEPGELCTRGYSVMHGYWDDRRATPRRSTRDGWMHTGDLATMDDDGYCNIVGRIKDMVIRGGENIYPREIEEFLFGIPRSQEVQVFGVPDAEYGEELCAWIQLRPGDASHRGGDPRVLPEARSPTTRCRATCASSKHFPMTVTGKIQKFLMRERMVAELGLKIETTA